MTPEQEFIQDRAWEQAWKELKRKGDTNTLRLRISRSVPYLSFPGLERINGICHGFSTRGGGVSRGMFASMNLSFTRGDEAADVAENYRRMARALGTSPERMVASHQTHTTNIKAVTGEDAGKGVVRPRDYEDVDGLITDVPELMLVTYYADCVPVYLADTKGRAVGLLHAGWRGTAGRIAAKGIAAIGEHYGVPPADLAAAVGPSICRDCYEIGEDVAQEFIQAFAKEEAAQILFYKGELQGQKKYQLDLWKANELVLRAAGVPAERIYVTDLCTCCNPRFLFSHRATGGKRGNLAAFLALRQSSV